jgi:hypothetical protein
MGPVGPSDGAGQHNATRLMRTCAADGTLLQPDRPMTPIDAAFRQAVSPAERQLGSAAVWSTYSQSGDSHAAQSAPSPAQYHILGVNVNATAGAVPVFATDMYPAPPSAVQFAVRDWHRQAECTAGADAVATGCVHLASGHDDAPLVALDGGMSWPYGTLTMQLHTATILQPGRFTLLGELDKFVPLSSKRFSDVKATAAGLTAVVTGQVGELVHATGLRPHGTAWLVVKADVLISEGGTEKFTLH